LRVPPTSVTVAASLIRTTAQASHPSTCSSAARGSGASVLVTAERYLAATGHRSGRCHPDGVARTRPAPSHRPPTGGIRRTVTRMTPLEGPRSFRFVPLGHAPNRTLRPYRGALGARRLCQSRGAHQGA